MKIFHTLILCLCTLSVYSQTVHQNSTDGVYIFQKATFSTYNYNTKAVLDTRIVDNPVLVDPTELFFLNVFQQVTINNGALSFCILPDNSEYIIENEVKLIPAKKTITSTKDNLAQDESDQVTSKQLTPYSLSIENDKLTFSVSYLYGDSQYNFPLEGKLTVILAKQK